MLPHPETVKKINALRNQERLQDITRQRHAINPGAGAPSRTPTLSTARLALPAWFTTLVACTHTAKRPMELIVAAINPARPANHIEIEECPGPNRSRVLSPPAVRVH